jgi:CelD/BcsL family acetyltransferase involved in cellulose biosynthesis
MSVGGWHAYDHRLTYRVGEITLGSVHLPVLRKVYALNEIRVGGGFPELPPLAPGAAGYLVAGVPQAGVAREVSKIGAYVRYCAKTYLHCYIDLDGDFAGYLAKFSGKTRSGIYRKVRKFTESAGGEDFRAYTRPGELDEFFRHARSVSSQSYQERLLDAGLPTDDGFLASAKAAAERDEVRAYLLFHRGQPVSYLYCPVVDDVLLYDYLGYLPDFAPLSVGTVLQWLALRSLFEERRFSAFDFTEGESEHKRLFSTHQTQCSNHLILHPTARNRAVVHTHRGLDRFSTWAGGVLDRYDLKRRVKRFVRRSA